jgi:hypothetical protein
MLITRWQHHDFTLYDAATTQGIIMYNMHGWVGTSILGLEDSMHKLLSLILNLVNYFLRLKEGVDIR